MSRLLIRLISFFIRDKGKRHKFRAKYDIVEKMKKFVVEQNLVLKHEILERLDIFDNILKTISVDPSSSLSYKNAIELNIINNKDEHLTNVKKLKKGLSNNSLENLNKILSKVDVANYRDRILLTEFYTKNELKDLERERIFLSEVTKKEDFFQYENFKLPKNYFEAATFLYNQGLDNIKTLKSMSEDSVIIDAGAFILDTALIFRRYCDNKSPS